MSGESDPEDAPAAAEAAENESADDDADTDKISAVDDEQLSSLSSSTESEGESPKRTLEEKEARRRADEKYSKFVTSSSEEDEPDARENPAQETESDLEPEESAEAQSPPAEESNEREASEERMAGGWVCGSAHGLRLAEEVDLFAHLPVYFPAISGCRSVEEFHCLNRIEEGTYGVVYRAKDKRTCACAKRAFGPVSSCSFVDEVVALKRLKMEKEKDDFPITSIREIVTLLKAQHPNIVTVRVRSYSRLFASCYCARSRRSSWAAIWTSSTL